MDTFDLRSYFKKNYLTESENAKEAITNSSSPGAIVPTKPASDPEFAELKFFPNKGAALKAIEALGDVELEVREITIPYITVKSSTDPGVEDKLSSGEYGSLD